MEKERHCTLALFYALKEIFQRDFYLKSHK